MAVFISVFLWRAERCVEQSKYEQCCSGKGKKSNNGEINCKLQFKLRQSGTQKRAGNFRYYQLKSLA